MNSKKLEIPSEYMFKEIKDTGLFVTEQTVNYAKSVKVLADNGLRLLTYQEAFINSSVLMKELSGKSFYVHGEVPKEMKLCTFDRKGNLLEPVGNEAPERLVRILDGGGPLSLHVFFDGSESRRFVLDACGGSFPVSRIVGVRLDYRKQLSNANDTKSIARR